MPELKKAEWSDYVGIRYNFELLKMTELTENLLISMDHITMAHRILVELFTIKDTKNTAIFLLSATIFILWYQFAVSLMMMGAAFLLLEKKYFHTTFTPWEPDVR